MHSGIVLDLTETDSIFGYLYGFYDSKVSKAWFDCSSRNIGNLYYTALIEVESFASFEGLKLMIPEEYL